MYKHTILNNLLEISQQPFLMFASRLEEKTDNAFETLCLLAQEDKVTAGRISEYLDIKPSSITQIINKLEEAGTAERVKSSEDARVVFVRITDKGREALADRSSISTQLKDELCKGFSEEELEQLHLYLSRINENVSSVGFQKKLDEIFQDDQRWQRFSKMSAHFGRSREQMLQRNRFGGGFHQFKKERK